MDPREMMKGMMGEGFNPMEMCRGMVGSVTRSAEMAAYATPELRGLFEEWLGQIEAEILEFLKGKDTVTPEEVAERFKLSKESAVFLVSKLARDGQIRISAGQNK
ncbi:MAG: helix-turn-helix domain-containing protein [Thermodesulfobacteriota bacterium]